MAGPASLTNSLQVRGDDEVEAGHGMWEPVLPDPSNSHHLQRYVDGLAVSGGEGKIGYKMKDRGREQETGARRGYLRDEDVDHAGEVDPVGLLDDVAQELTEQVVTPGGEGVKVRSGCDVVDMSGQGLLVGVGPHSANCWDTGMASPC